MTLVNSSAPTRPRDVAAAATLWLPLLAVVVTWLLWIDRLPDVLPRQWGRDGAVSSTMPTEAMAAIAVVVSVGAAILATSWLRERGAPNRRPVYLGLGFAAGLSSCLWLSTAGITIAASDAEPEMGAWVLFTVAACGYGVLPFLLAHKWLDPASPEPVEVRAGTTDADLPVTWTKLVTSPVVAVVGGAVLLGGVVGVIAALRDDGLNSPAAATVMTAVVVGVILLVTVGFVQVRVSVDRRGLRDEGYGMRV
jgi:hypothetical protein